jgi:hypothetical protein
MSSPARPRRLGAYLRPRASLLGPLAGALAAMTVLPLVGPMLVSRFVLADGRVADRGPLKTLLERSPEMRRLWREEASRLAEGELTG